jgi:hypothetical protein
MNDPVHDASVLCVPLLADDVQEDNDELPKDYERHGRGSSFKMELKCNFHHSGCRSALLLEFPVREVTCTIDKFCKPCTFWDAFKGNVHTQLTFK